MLGASSKIKSLTSLITSGARSYKVDHIPVRTLRYRHMIIELLTLFRNCLLMKPLMYSSRVLPRGRVITIHGPSIVELPLIFNNLFGVFVDSWLINSMTSELIRHIILPLLIGLSPGVLLH